MTMVTLGIVLVAIPTIAAICLFLYGVWQIWRSDRCAALLIFGCWLLLMMACEGFIILANEHAKEVHADPDPSLPK